MVATGQSYQFLFVSAFEVAARHHFWRRLAASSHSKAGKSSNKKGRHDGRPFYVDCLFGSVAWNGRLSKDAILFVSDETEFGDAAPLHHGQRLVDNVVHRGRGRLELQFGFRAH